MVCYWLEARVKRVYQVCVKAGIGLHADKMLCVFVGATLQSAMEVQRSYLKKGVCACITKVSGPTPWKENSST